MKCPVCKTSLVVVERESIEVDWCPTCRGIWFDVGELDILAAKAGKRIAPREFGTSAATDEARRRCPRCRHKMDKITPVQ
ncbi:MAG: zf-TFIIB domain-containing protein, partial [Gammaproteobacteria bacterium]